MEFRRESKDNLAGSISHCGRRADIGDPKRTTAACQTQIDRSRAFVCKKVVRWSCVFVWLCCRVCSKSTNLQAAEIAKLSGNRRHWSVFQDSRFRCPKVSGRLD